VYTIRFFCTLIALQFKTLFASAATSLSRSPCFDYIQFIDVCYYSQNKVKDLVIVANGHACSLLIDGHNSSDLQLAICGCAACKHWQRPSCIYKSIGSQMYLADSRVRAREVVYAFIVCVCTQAMGIC